MKKQQDNIVKNTLFLLMLTLILGAILGSVYFVKKSRSQNRTRSNMTRH